MWPSIELHRILACVLRGLAGASASWALKVRGSFLWRHRCADVALARRTRTPGPRDIHVSGQDPEHFVRVTHVDPSIVITVGWAVCVGVVLLILAASFSR
jgi:hypothetical protein